MGMRLAEVYALTPEELSPILEAWAERDEERRRERWEQTRLLAYFATLPYQKKGRRFRPQDLLPFPWEKGTPAQTTAPPSDADIERISQRFGEG